MSVVRKFLVLLPCLLLATLGHAAPPTCSITASTGIAFGNYFSSTPTPTTGLGTLTIVCTKSFTNGSISITPATGRVMSSGSNTLLYNVYTTSSYASVWGDGTSGTVVQTFSPTANVPFTVPVYGRIPAGQTTFTPPVVLMSQSLTVTTYGYGPPNDTATATFTVTASATGSCTISAVGTMNFGSLGLSFMTTDKSGVSASINYTCSTGMPVTITLGQGANPGSGSSDAAPLRRMKLGATSNYISYNLYTDNTYSTVWGNTAATGVTTTGTGAGQTALVYGKANHATVPVGSYSDVVVVTLTF
jgi:spore coat protein U domain-containing protein, fimbrial subunit CupE1/2/3/6